MTERLALAIVGGGPAGLSAARAYRDADGEGDVAIVTEEERMPYNRPPLTKELLRGEMSPAELPLEEEAWLAERDVRLVGGRAVALDIDRRTVTLSGGRQLEYANCVLASGAEPTRLPIPGVDDPSVRVLRSLDQFFELQRRIDEVGHVVVVGSGFIGCEIAASLRMRGHAVTLMSDEQAPNAARLGDEAAAEIAGWLDDDGVELKLGRECSSIQRNGAALNVVAGDTRLTAPLVVMAAGVAPRVELAVAAGLELDEGAIPVDASMRAAVPGLLAAGDVCVAQNPAAGRALRVEHWGDALKQGAVAGCTAAGESAAWSDVPGFWSTIGSRTLKYSAWGDGFDETRMQRHAGNGFTVWYGSQGRIVGVLTHEADNDYERGAALISDGAAWATLLAEEAR
jgi:NADPH-dependent 2,4-dienoyl-CoA reductase/sulfur reductase-like enzyme